MIATVINLKSEKTNAHSGDIRSVAFSPDGKAIVSGSHNKTIKVWDSGAFWASSRPSLAKTDACWLVWQLRWISRRRRPTPTAIGSIRWCSLQTGPRSCPARTTRRSKFGMLSTSGPMWSLSGRQLRVMVRRTTMRTMRWSTPTGRTPSLEICAKSKGTQVCWQSPGSGMQVRFGPQIALRCPNLTSVGLFGSYAGSQDEKDQRPQ